MTSIEPGEPAEAREVVRPGIRRGYDLWAPGYDTTPNPVLALDRRYALGHLDPGPGELILDAGCGTGGHLGLLAGAGARPIALDFSEGMLAVALARHRDVPLVAADLSAPLPFRTATFDAALCSLVSEHLHDLARFFGEMRRVLRPGGRLVFSAFHPDRAAAGVEANFRRDGIEYRLGAEAHRIADFVGAATDAGFETVRTREYCVDGALAEEVPVAAKYLGVPLLAVVVAG